MGIEHGIFPEPVFWIWNPDTTNKNYKNNCFGDAYYLLDNTNRDVVVDMVTESLLNLTEKPSIAEVGNSLFIHINRIMKRDTSILNNNKW